MLMTDEPQRTRPLMIAPALLAALIVLSSDAALAGPVAPAARQALSSGDLTVIARHLDAVRIIRAAASYPATIAVRREAAIKSAQPQPTLQLLRESLLALPPPVC